MKPVKEAKKYAKTFINIVGIEEAPKALAELALLENLMTKSREFRSLLVNPGFSSAERESGLKQVAVRFCLSEKIVKFVIHLTADQSDLSAFRSHKDGNCDLSGKEEKGEGHSDDPCRDQRKE